MLLNYAKRNTALWLAGSTTEVPGYFMIGSGSGTAIASQTTLIYPLDRQAVTSTNSNTLYKITWQGDWNSVEMSGLNLSEFGMTVNGTGSAGSMWSRTSTPNINFDGTNELQIQEIWEGY